MRNPESLERLLGQLLVCGFQGSELPSSMKARLEEGRCGGVILFRRNIHSPTQVARLTAQIYEASPQIAPWIGVDQEGGRVRRLLPPFAELPPAAVLGFVRDESWASRFGEIIGEEAAAAGFNVVFAPVLDVHTNPANPIIGDRSVGSDPQEVARLGLALARGLDEFGVMPCAKHFPGHGDTAEDSHLMLPTVDQPRPRLERIELAPFAQAAKASIPAIMSAHVLFPALDPQRPATLSPLLIHKILRRDWGYNGLVFSDDLEMKGVAHHYSMEEMMLLGLEAGLDQFLICSREDLADQAFAALRQLVEENKITEERLLQSWQRIQEAKQRFASTYRGLPPEQLEAFLQEDSPRQEDAATLRQAWQLRGQDVV